MDNYFGPLECRRINAEAALYDRASNLAKLGEHVLDILNDLETDACPEERYRSHWNLGRVQGAARVLGLWHPKPTLSAQPRGIREAVPPEEEHPKASSLAEQDRASTQHENDERIERGER